MIGPYELRPLECRDYDPRHAVVAKAAADHISSRLPDVRVEHVGSTAVPGCAGKGIVDLMIAVPDGRMAEVKESLEELGFQRQPHRDPFPEDRPMRVGSLERDGEIFLLHVHCIPADSPEVEDMCFFSVCLQADPELLRAYVECKRKIIASGTTDSTDYCVEKGRFIDSVLK
jgi:GrpB-like predicted nucleotidyltransferase (UPF0157 family)